MDFSSRLDTRVGVSRTAEAARASVAVSRSSARINLTGSDLTVALSLGVSRI